MDDFYADMHRGIDQRRAAGERMDLAARYQKALDTVVRERDQLRGYYDALIASNAGNLALRYALTSQLAKFDPNNPLVRDADLRDRISRHAKDTINATNGDWDAVRELGATFKIPGGRD